MAIDENLNELAGMPVRDYEPGSGLPDAAAAAWRLRRQPGGPPFVDGVVRPFLAEPGVPSVRALVIGAWTDNPVEDSSTVLAELTLHAYRFPALRALFLGDVTEDECPISLIRHGDVGVVATSFPGLEEYWIRGSAEMKVPPLAWRSLRRLTIESGGLPSTVVRNVAASALPLLEHLELWLGSEGSGGDATMADLRPVLDGQAFPLLRRLGLRNAGIADEVAAALAKAPVAARLEELDLSLGTLGDEGVLALLRGQPLERLSFLDLHHHYLSEDGMAQVRASGLGVDLSDRQDEVDGERYVAVGELR